MKKLAPVSGPSLARPTPCLPSLRLQRQLSLKPSPRLLLGVAPRIVVAAPVTTNFKMRASDLQQQTSRLKLKAAERKTLAIRSPSQAPSEPHTDSNLSLGSLGCGAPYATASRAAGTGGRSKPAASALALASASAAPDREPPSCWHLPLQLSQRSFSCSGEGCGIADHCGCGNLLPQIYTLCYAG